MVFASIRLRGVDSSLRQFLYAGLEIDLHHMAPQPDRRGVTEGVRGYTGVLVLGDLLSFAQDLGNAACRYVLFRNNQVHRCHASFF